MLAATLVASLVASTALAAPNGALLMNDDASWVAAFEATPGFNIDLYEKRLIQFEDAEPVWMTELEKIQAKARGLRFFDITDTPNLGDGMASFKPKAAYPKPNLTDLVQPVLDSLTIDGPVENLQTFSNFRTRYYRSDTGRESQLWLLAKIGEVTAEYASESMKQEISISEFEHSWGQNTIIVKITGSSDPNTSVIVSAHQDSTNLFPFLPAPGADDDGSGTVTILEAYRGLLAAKYRPEKTVEFHWYAAEEGGLLGSQAVAQAYKSSAANVYAQIQFDMTAWIKKGTREEVGIMTDFVDPELTAFLKLLVAKYIEIPFAETKCGYGCSDHASWVKAGYAGSCAFEGQFQNSDNHIHSTNDRIDVSDEFSFPHLLHFSKIAAAFAIELGGWKHK